MDIMQAAAILSMAAGHAPAQPDLHTCSGGDHAGCGHAHAAPRLASNTSARPAIDFPGVAERFRWGPLTREMLNATDPEQTFACFDPGTVLTPELMETLSVLMGDEQQNGEFDPRFNVGTRWGNARGTPVTVSWSLVPDGTPMGAVTLLNGQVVLGTEGSSLLRVMDGNFGGQRSTWVNYIQGCFNAISAFSGIRFVQVPDDGAPMYNSSGVNGVRGDIRIGARHVDGQSGILAFANSDITLDVQEIWSNNSNGFRYFRNVFSHELCHALGLSHSCPTNQTKLMEPFLVTSFDGPQQDDIRGLNELYGDTAEPNNSQAVAFQMTESLPNTSFTFFGYPFGGGPANTAVASVRPGDVDWYRSSLGAQMPVTVTITPVGSTYDASAQNADGSCNSGNFVNSLTQSPLRVELRNSTGALITQADGLMGQPVTVSASVPGGSYYTVVRPVLGTFASPQSYTLRRTIGAPQPPANDTCANATNMGFGLPTAGTNYGSNTDGDSIIEPGGTIGSQDVYYRFTAWATGRIVASVTGGANFVIAVHRNQCPVTTGSQLSRPDATNHGGRYGSMYADVVAGTQYIIRVATAPGGTWGSHTVAVNMLNGVANDVCSSAIPIGLGATNGNTSTARPSTLRHGSCTSPIYNSEDPRALWYSYTATANGTLNANTCGPAFNTILSVWDGCPDSGGQLLTCNDNTPNPADCLFLGSDLSLRVNAGQTYFIRVAGANSAAGAFPLNLSLIRQGETCGDPFTIDEGSTAFNTAGATTDGPTEANCGFCCFETQVGADLWYAYTPSASGIINVNTCGSNYDSKLAAYASCPTGNNQAIACNDDSPACNLQSSMTFAATGGQTYLIRVGGYAFSTGSGTINITRTSCASDFNNDGFVDFFDFDDFVSCFEGAGCPAGRTADFNNDGFADFFDFDDFIISFQSGC
jgi:hypothetical protein